MSITTAVGGRFHFPLPQVFAFIFSVLGELDINAFVSKPHPDFVLSCQLSAGVSATLLGEDTTRQTSNMDQCAKGMYCNAK